MRLYRHDYDLPEEARGAVVTLGNFDGVHRGHQTVIASAAGIAKAKNRPLGVVTFEPHTRDFFRPGQPPFRLTPLRTKLYGLEILGVDQVVVLAFDQAFSELSADEFARRILHQGLGIDHAVAGADFRYGHQHAGTMETLTEAGARYGFGVTAIPAARSADGTVYSATTIRGLIAGGDMRRATALLGWPWEINGRVITGEQRGRELGFPTANLEFGEYMTPAFGIYAVRAKLPQGQDWIDGVASLGIRPMWQVEEPLLEVHLFNFNADIYGKILRVRLIERLRAEVNFETIDQLVEQVERDKENARAALARPDEPEPRS